LCSFPIVPKRWVGDAGFEALQASRYRGAKDSPYERDALLKSFVTMLKISRIMLFLVKRPPGSGRYLPFEKLYRNNGNEDAEPGEPVAEARVDGFVRAKIVGQVDSGATSGASGSKMRP
jgi:hypothetical protein